MYIQWDFIYSYTTGLHILIYIYAQYIYTIGLDLLIHIFLTSNGAPYNHTYMSTIYSYIHVYQADNPMGACLHKSLFI